MWSWIKMECMIIVPDNGLHNKRKWAEVTLMGDGSYKLQHKLESHYFHKLIYKRSIKSANSTI